MTKIISIALGSILFCGILYAIYADELFTRDDARDLILEHDFVLLDPFEIIKNESSAAIGDYEHMFTLKISDDDKNRVIQKIKSTQNYSPNRDSSEELRFRLPREEQVVKIQNYETNKYFVYEYFESSKDIGYSEIIISINKAKSELIFHEIDE